MKPFLFPFVILVSLVISCQQTEENIAKEAINQQEMNTENKSNTFTYLALGDSYTIGESVDEKERWPVILTEALKAKGLNLAPPKIIAKTGWTTNELQEAITKENLQETFNLVSLLIGVNNQYRGYSFAQYEKEFVELLEQAIAFAGKDSTKVFVVSIPDYGVTPFAAESDTAKIAKELDAYNAYARTICQEKNIPFFDITPLSRKAKEDVALVAADNLHPSGKMYAQWVELFADEVEKLLK